MGREQARFALLGLLMLACSPSAGDSGGALAPDPFADRVVSFTPGSAAGFGQDELPGIVLGGPEGAGEGAGSLDVVSLGEGGEIILAFDDIVAIDGEGADLVVFENPFGGWIETGHVAVSEDGEEFHEWPCDPEAAEESFPGCAGVGPVYADSSNGLDPTDPEVAGGDAFDLADLGLGSARYVRLRDSGHNAYSADTGGFDLDAVAVINGVEE